MTLRVTGTMLFAEPGALKVIKPAYVPPAIPAGFAETMTVPGVVPLVGVAVSQEAFEDDAAYESGEPVAVIVSACARGIEPPF